MASNHSIVPADGVEPVESLQLAARLSVNVIIGEKKKSLEEEKKISGRKCKYGQMDPSLAKGILELQLIGKTKTSCHY